MITTDPKILVLAFLSGIIPSLLWLWFWLKEEENPEPKGLLTVIFILGMIAVVVALFIEKFIQAHLGSQIWQIIKSIIITHKYISTIRLLIKHS